MGNTIKTKTAAAALVIAALLVSGTAFGGTTPNPKVYSTIAGDSITLKDVFDGVKDNADFYLAPAPEVGKTTILTTKDLVRISNALNLGWSPKNQDQRTIIRRSTAVIKSSDITNLLEAKTRETLPNREFEIELTNNSLNFNIPEGEDKSLKIESFEFNPAKMTVTATISSIARPEEKRDVKGLLSYITKVPVLTEAKHKGEVISRDDIDFIKMKSSDITSGVILGEEDLIGKTPRNNIQAMTPMLDSDMKLPTIVKRGDTVIMNFKSEKINLTTQGVATQDGTKGDIIKIENLTSKQVISAVVTGEREVSIVINSMQQTSANM